MGSKTTIAPKEPSMADLTFDVLIVVDERIQREEMAGFLARAGLTIVMAASRGSASRP